MIVFGGRKMVGEVGEVGEEKSVQPALPPSLYIASSAFKEL